MYILATIKYMHMCTHTSMYVCLHEIIICTSNPSGGGGGGGGGSGGPIVGSDGTSTQIIHNILTMRSSLKEHLCVYTRSTN